MNSILFPARRLASHLDHLFPSFFDFEEFPLPSFLGAPASFRPLVNVWSDDEALHVELEVPGLAEDDLEIDVLARELTISGERKVDRPEGATLHHGERRFGAFKRVVGLPVDVEADKVQAALAHGVLTITLPKAEAERPRRIPLKVEQD